MAELFGPYRLDEVIGRGGMGVVYRAFDTRRDRTVALKRLPAELAGDENFQARFRRESKLAARLNEPHIIPIHDFGEIDGQLFIDMRLVEGLDLGKLIADEGGSLTPERAVDIITQVASALSAAHNAGLMHRDIKPSNVLITGLNAEDRSSPFAYLVDFGIARAILGSEGTALTTTTDWFGTVAYMAPERIRGSSGDSRSDIYSLACLLYQSLTGQAPFTGEALQVLFAHVNNAPPSAAAVRDEIPSGLDAVIRKGMAKSPDDRYQTAAAFAAAARSSLRGGKEARAETQVIAQKTRPMQTTPRPAGPPQSFPPPPSGPTNSVPPRPAGPSQSFPPQPGPPHSIPPRSAGPPQSYPPRTFPPHTYPPQSYPSQSGPPNSIPPRSAAPRQRQPGKNRALVVMVAVAVVVALAAGIAVLVAVNDGGDTQAGGPSPTTSNSISGPTASGPSSSGPSSSGPSSSGPSTPAGWSNYSQFSSLIGTGPMQQADTFRSATCELRGPDESIKGMVDQVACSELSGGSKVVFYVGRFTGKAATDDYLAELVKRKYAKRYWTIEEKRRGQLLTSPESAKFADVTSSICGMPEFLVQFYAESGAGVTVNTLQSLYWKKAAFPDSPPSICP